VGHHVTESIAFLVELQDFQLWPTTVMMLDTAERMRQFEK